MIEVRIEGIENAQAALARLEDPALPGDMAKRVADAVVQPKLAQYPSPSGRSQPFRSDKSRKYFFAALTSGQISVPYRRTGRLGAPGNWTQTPEESGLTLTSTTPYSDLVIGQKGRQAKYFVGVWPSVDETAEAVEPEAALTATAVLVERIGDAA